MHRKITITLDEAIYEGVYRLAGRRRVSRFIEDLLRPYVTEASLDEGYIAMANDSSREADAAEWCDALAGDIGNEAR